MKRIVFTGGGSAGHVIPNLALIEELQTKGTIEVYYVGTAGIEKDLVSPFHIPYHQISCPKLARGLSLTTLKNNIKIPFAFHRAKKQALEALRLIQPNLVFSKGGYVALPVIAAAKKLRIPCFAHESDLSAGLSNKLSAKNCQRMFTSFPETAKTLPNGIFVGAPIRRSLFNISPKEARNHFHIPQDETVILVFGGGSGSVCINEAVRKQLRTLTNSHTILHVCGKGNTINSNIRRYHQFEFIKDMGMAYAAADLIISRAGAGTIFEILSLKKPSILIPLENATRGDQKQNASYFEKKGLCHVLRQKHLDKLPFAIEQAMADHVLKENLKKTQFGCGNTAILSDIYAILGDNERIFR